MWQKCPICAGSGVEHYDQDYTSTAIKFPTTCSVCKGKKIISEITGLPPEWPSEGITVTYGNNPSSDTITAEQVDKFINGEKIQGL